MANLLLKNGSSIIFRLKSDAPDKERKGIFLPSRLGNCILELTEEGLFSHLDGNFIVLKRLSP